MRLVYFLGAGAAQPCGYQTTPELYRSLMGERGGLLLFKEFGDAMSEVFRHEPIDIEVLYTLATQSVSELTSSAYANLASSSIGHRLLHQMLLRHSAWGDSLKALQGAFDECREVIIDFIREKFWEVKPDIAPYTSLMLDEATNIEGGIVEIFTTNYDTSIEDFLDGRLYYDRIQSDDVIAAPSPAHPASNPIRIVKLHGSVDLYRLQSGKIAYINSFQRPGPWKAGEVIEGPYLVPPQIGAIKYDSNQKKLLDHFSAVTKHASAMVIIGSSFRDEVIASILSGAPKNAMILVACGSHSEEIVGQWFPNHEKVVSMDQHFPNNEITEWIWRTVQFLREEKQEGKRDNNASRTPPQE